MTTPSTGQGQATQMKELPRSILIVEDDDVFRRRLAQAFADRGFEVREARDADEALDAARQDTPEFVVVDLRMPGRSGLDVVRELKALDAATSIVVLTGYGSIATALEAVRLGAQHYLTKPADVEAILAAFERRTDAAAPPADAPIPMETPSLARVEWEHINRVLMDCNGNVSQAARVLGLHRRSLQRKLSKFPLPR
jgi:two-component system, response regulator RegA